MDERWFSPYNHTIAYTLFMRHFSELNDVYWSYVPAACTVEKKAKDGLGSGDANPTKYFLIRDDDERHMPLTYDAWKLHFREFGNYTRLSMLMLLSSCFETYLRTIVSLAIESKPGAIIQCPDAVDGCMLLKKDPCYGDSNAKTYQFGDVIEEICVGEWTKRANALKKYFGDQIISDIDLQQLDKMRVTRNDIGHHFGRTKKDYHTPLSFDFEQAHRLAHETLLKYFCLVHSVTKKIDEYLQRKYIGSYDLIKYYYSCLRSGKITGEGVGQHAKDFMVIIGNAGLPPLNGEFCINLLTGCFTGDYNCTCRYTTRVCVKMLQRKLDEQSLAFFRGANQTKLNQSIFKQLVKQLQIKGNSELCKKITYEKQNENLYSQRAIDMMISYIASYAGKELFGYKVCKK